MNWLILAVSTANLVITTTVVVIANKKAKEALAEANLMKDKVNGAIRGFSHLTL